MWLECSTTLISGVSFLKRSQNKTSVLMLTAARTAVQVALECTALSAPGCCVYASSPLLNLMFLALKVCVVSDQIKNRHLHNCRTSLCILDL